MSDSTSATRAAERDDHAPARQALQAVQVSLDRRDNGGDGAALDRAAMLDK
jgi:hypothetical protein